MKPLISVLLLISALLSMTAIASTDLAPHDSKRCSPDGIALGGYDVVAYHTVNKAVMGSSDWSVLHNGLMHQFSSEDHLQLFNAEPEKYLPKFSGWCATALAKNNLTCPDYENFKIENGELLLFETYAFSNGRYFWERNPDKHRIAAEKNYSQFFSQ